MPRRNPSKHDDVEDDDDDRPQPKRKRLSGKRPKKRRKPIGLIVGLALGGVVLLSGVLVAIVLLTREKPAPAPAPFDPFPNMLAHWSFDDVRVNPDETTTIVDGTGRKNNGTMIGGRLAPGRKGNALWLDGRDDTYVDVSSSKDLSFAPQTELTIAAWFLAREKYSGTIIAFHHPTLPTQLDIFVRDNRVIGIIGDDQDTGQHGFVWGEQKPAIPTAGNGQWHHVAMTRHGKFVEVFYDGVYQGVDARGNSGGKLSGGLGAIGCHLGFVKNNIKNFGRPGFNGAIDEVYVFSRALKQNEVQALMNR